MNGAMAALAALVLAGTAGADPAEGFWQTRPDDNGNVGIVHIAPCGERLCGVLEKSFDKAGKPFASPNIGKRIVWDMKPEGGGAYGGGKVWAPDRDKTYYSTMKLHGPGLDVFGCLIPGMLCRNGGTWSRVK